MPTAVMTIIMNPNPWLSFDMDSVEDLSSDVNRDIILNIYFPNNASKGVPRPHAPFNRIAFKSPKAVKEPNHQLHHTI